MIPELWQSAQKELDRGVDPEVLAEEGQPVNPDGTLRTVDYITVGRILDILYPEAAAAGPSRIDIHTRVVGLMAVNDIRAQLGFHSYRRAS